jgi:hypothetical protein
MRTLAPNSRGAQPPRILNADELREHLAARFLSGAWWLLVAASPVGSLFEEIERRFYAGSANEDFELA